MQGSSMEPSRPLAFDINAVTSLLQREFGPRTVLKNAQQAQSEDAIVGQILAARGAEEILSLVDQAHAAGELADFHVAAACRRLALFRSGLPHDLTYIEEFQQFVVHSKLALARHPMDPQSTVSLLWSISLLQYQIPRLQELLSVVCESWPKASHRLNLQNLTNSLTAVVKLQRNEQSVLSLVQPLLQSIVDKVDELEEPVHIAATIFAAGELRLDKEQLSPLTTALFPKLSHAHLQKFDFKQLAKLAWGLAELGERNFVLLDTIANVTIELLPNTDKRVLTVELPVITCALAKQQIDNHALIEAAAIHLKRKGVLRHMSAWGVCALSWFWPNLSEKDHSGNVREVANLLDMQITVRKLSTRKVATAYLGPKDWNA